VQLRLQHDADDEHAWPKPMQHAPAMQVWRTPQLDAGQSLDEAQPHCRLTHPAPGMQPLAVQSTQLVPAPPHAEAPVPLAH
jgi:hypothetical protein